MLSLDDLSRAQTELLTACAMAPHVEAWRGSGSTAKSLERLGLITIKVVRQQANAPTVTRYVATEAGRDAVTAVVEYIERWVDPGNGQPGNVHTRQVWDAYWGDRRRV